MAVDSDCAEAVVLATKDFSDDLWLVVPAGSLAVGVARSSGLKVAEEAFCDRGYLADGSLSSRGDEGAVITDPDEAARRAVRLACEGEVDTIDGATLRLAPATLCVHGDTPGAARLAHVVRTALEGAGLTVGSFVAR
jgi:UPF0271 protein